jgi:hypothetical protein
VNKEDCFTCPAALFISFIITGYSIKSPRGNRGTTQPPLSFVVEGQFFIASLLLKITNIVVWINVWGFGIELAGGQEIGIVFLVLCRPLVLVAARQRGISNQALSETYTMLADCPPEVIVTSLALLLACGSSILMTLPLSCRISSIFTPPLPMIASIISLGMNICEVCNVPGTML